MYAGGGSVDCVADAAVIAREGHRCGRRLLLDAGDETDVLHCWAFVAPDVPAVALTPQSLRDCPTKNIRGTTSFFTFQIFAGPAPKR